MPRWDAPECSALSADEMRGLLRKFVPSCERQKALGQHKGLALYYNDSNP